jgi:hypothetical protein
MTATGIVSIDFVRDESPETENNWRTSLQYILRDDG